MSTRFDEVVAVLPGVLDADRSPAMVSDVEHDSRRVGADCLFACIRGATSDGHDFAAAALDAGAAGLVVERRLDVEVPQVVVRDVRRALGPAAAAVHNRPSLSLAVLGVTGTNGKTTTVSMIASLVRALGGSVLEIGTLTGERTTPEAPELQRLLANARSEGVEVVAMEVSSHAIEQGRVDGVYFHAAAFTNLGVDHLDHHGDLESYFGAKAALFVPERTPVAVVNIDDSYGRRLATTASVTIVAVESAQIPIIDVSPQACTFIWRGQQGLLPLGGAFNVMNAAIAAEMVATLDFSEAEILAALARVESVPGRFERIDAGQSFAVVVDYAHTPEGLDAVLSAAREITKRRLIVVFGAGGDRDRSKRPRMGKVACKRADRVVLTNDNPRNESASDIIAGIVSGMNRPPELIEPDRRTAIRYALAVAHSGDVLVIAGKGHEATQTIGADVVDFDDRVVAREEIQRLLETAS